MAIPEPSTCCRAFAAKVLRELLERPTWIGDDDSGAFAIDIEEVKRRVADLTGGTNEPA